MLASFWSVLGKVTSLQKYVRIVLISFRRSPLGLPVVAAIGLKDRSSNAFEQVVNQLQDLMTCYKNA